MEKISTSILFLFFAAGLSAQLNSKTIEAEWLDKNCISIKYIKAENGFDDLYQLNNLIGDARIVELGECTHGSSEVFSMKHRILEYLVKEKGFTIFSIEAAMPESYALNEYVLSGKGDVKKLMAGMYFWTWNTQEVLDMIEWMKKYNETATAKIYFTGIDMQSPKGALKNIRIFAERNIPQLLSVINGFDTIYTQLQYKANTRLMKQHADEFKQMAKVIKDSLNLSIVAVPEKRWLLQCTKILEEYAYLIENNEIRDEYMSENAKWILDENPNAKMVIWAHNEHIRKGKNKFGQIRMREYLNKAYGKQMIAIGFTSDEGTYTAVQRTRRKFIGLDSTNSLISSQKGSYENIFRTAFAPNYLLDLRNIPENNEGANWLLEKKLFRHIGAGANEKFQFIDSHLTKEYDMIIFLRKTTASKCFWLQKLADKN